tara:strand:+ start:13956 stop:14174 length:219 start_codon:yes stop_codon:yes gene_type:complete
MGFMRSRKPPPPPPPPPARPVITPAQVKETKRTEDINAQKKGQAASIVTGGQGLLSEAPTNVPTLLGQNKLK